MTGIILALFLVVVLEVGRHPPVVARPYAFPPARVLGGDLARVRLLAPPAAELCGRCHLPTLTWYLEGNRGIPDEDEVCRGCDPGTCP